MPGLPEEEERLVDGRGLGDVASVLDTRPLALPSRHPEFSETLDGSFSAASRSIFANVLKKTEDVNPY